MKIGIAASTHFEIQPTLQFIQEHQHTIGENSFEFVITGVGLLATTYELAAFIFKQQPDYMIQAGICGSFSQQLTPGHVVLIEHEVMGDLGVEENGSFRDVFDLGFVQPSAFPFVHKRLTNPYMASLQKFKIPAAIGITVNEISTHPARIKCLVERYNCQTESMEGAAFHYVCLHQNIPFFQLRSVSNEIGERDKSKWNLRAAIENLNQKLIDIIPQIE
jgi:futalosine hydrolase